MDGAIDAIVTPTTPARIGAARRALLACIVVLAVAGDAWAADLPKDDVHRVRDVVEQQLKAFAEGDAGKAFSLADPGIRSKFGTPEQFMNMVRAQYPMVHRPSSVTFLKPEADGATAYQKVRMTDRAGATWLVTYLLNRQQDGQWRISACLVTPDAPRLST